MIKSFFTFFFATLGVILAFKAYAWYDHYAADAVVRAAQDVLAALRDVKHKL
jgi:hypothetical protein